MDSRCTAQVVSTIDDTTTGSSRASWGLFWIVHIVHISLNEHIVQRRLVGTLRKPLAIVRGGRPPPVVRCLNTEPQPQVVTSDSSLARRFYQFCLFFLHFRQKQNGHWLSTVTTFETLSQWFSDSYFEISQFVKDQPSETHKSGQKLKLLALKVPIVTHVLQER